MKINIQEIKGLKVLRTLKQNNNLLKFKKKRLLRASFSF